MVHATLEIMIRTARKAGRSLIRDYGELEHLQILKKGPADFVSVADKKAEDIIKDALHYARPEYAFIGEESGLTGDQHAEHVFIVDPLDGTSNFLHAIPHFAVSIAYAYQNEVVAGVIYDPIKDELFSAEKGGGAYLNNNRIRASGREDLSECLIATGAPFKGVNEDKIPEYTTALVNVIKNTAGIRRLGAMALDLAYVAAGRQDAFFEYGGNTWDIAAGLIIATEAGALVVNETNHPYTFQSQGKQNQWILASNNTIKQDMYRLLFG